MALIILFKDQIKDLVNRVVLNHTTEEYAPSYEPSPTPEPATLVGMRPIESETELGSIVASASGVILNDPPRDTGGEANKVLHAVNCRTLRNANLSTPKLFGESADDAVEWLKTNRGEEDDAWKRCGICKP